MCWKDLLVIIMQQEALIQNKGTEQQLTQSAMWYKRAMFEEKVVIPEDLIRDLVNQEVKKILEDRKILIYFRKVDNKIAEEEIRKFIISKKSEGTAKISFLDIVVSLNLPPEQVEIIIEKFEKEGKISEIDG